MKDAVKKTVYWKSKLTDFKGNGKPILNAQAWADYGNRNFPDIKHWVK